MVDSDITTEDIEMMVLSEFVKYAIERYENNTNNRICGIRFHRMKSAVPEINGEILVGFTVEKAPVV